MAIDLGPLRLGWIGLRAFWADYRAGLCGIGWALVRVPHCFTGRVGPVYFAWQWYPNMKRRSA